MEQPSDPVVSEPVRRHPAVAVVFRIVTCVVVLAIGLGIATALTATAPTPATVDRGDRAIRVMGVELAVEPVARRWRGYGTVEALDMAMVPSRVASTVVAVPESVRTGLPVVAGAVLATLDPSDYENQAESSRKQIGELEAQLDRLDTEAAALVDQRELGLRELQLAQSDLERVQDAGLRGAALPREVDLAEQAVLAARRALVTLDEAVDGVPVRRRAIEARLDQLSAAAAVASAQVERCTVVAPFDGVIADVLVEQGEKVLPGSPIARILDPDELVIPLRIPATARGRVDVGDEVVIQRTVQGRPRSASVVRISPEDELGSRTMTVFVGLEDPQGEFVPGLFVAGEVIERRSEPALLIPRRAVRNQRVLLVQDGRIEHRPVEVRFGLSTERPGTGLADRQWLVIDPDLPDGAVIVADGARALEVGAAVEVVTPVPGSDDS